MAKIDEIYVREVRDDLGRYPTWPPNKKPVLGRVGFYNGRRASFDWKHDLASLGVSIPTPEVENHTGEFYASKNAVSYKYSTSATKFGEASFKFGRGGAVAARSMALELVTLPIGPLETAIINAIASKKLNWNKHWVIVTAIYRAASYTALISSSKKCNARLSTSIPISGPAFDIADPHLGVTLTASDDLYYQTIAEAGAEPFFQIHKLIFRDKSPLYLKEYGAQRSWYSF